MTLGELIERIKELVDDVEFDMDEELEDDDMPEL